MLDYRCVRILSFDPSKPPYVPTCWARLWRCTGQTHLTGRCSRCVAGPSRPRTASPPRCRWPERRVSPDRWRTEPRAPSRPAPPARSLGSAPAGWWSTCTCRTERGTTTAGFWVVQWQLLFSSLNICRFHSSTTQWPRDYCAKGSLQLLLQTSGPAPPSCDGLQKLHQDQNQQREQITEIQDRRWTTRVLLRRVNKTMRRISELKLRTSPGAASDHRVQTEAAGTEPEYAGTRLLCQQSTLVPDYSVRRLLYKSPSVSRNISTHLFISPPSLLVCTWKTEQKINMSPRMHCGIKSVQSLSFKLWSIWLHYR